MVEPPAAPAAPPPPPRPLPATYWVVPGRFLVGEHPGSQSRAEAMDRLRRFLVAGVTCFVDLTEPNELPSYEALLPFATPEGRRVEYLREPIRDHSVPDGHEVVARAIAMIDDALDAGHVVYLHCRAGIGRSATVAGCWLASRASGALDPLEQLQGYWQQSERSARWPIVPETEEQAEFVRDWSRRSGTSRGRGAPAAAALSVEDRIRGALLGLALGDATGAASRQGGPGSGAWTQHTALALCLTESLLDTGRCDARDQIERYLAWQRTGHLSALGLPGQPTPDVARALATYQWRGLPMAGSHDPRDRSASSLPRVVSAAVFAVADPAAAVTLAVECSRTTHQSPIVLDACRCYAALIVGALRGTAPATLLGGVYEPVAGFWNRKPLKAELVAALTAPLPANAPRQRAHPADVVQAVVHARAAVAAAQNPGDAIDQAIRDSQEPALDGALAGALAGALWGAAALPGEHLAALARRDTIEGLAQRCVERERGQALPAVRA
ncbi:MAG: ADP-ribosylglycohydrolase family protein [Steroidobacteraceae bacterium]|nr:ADP-ribosylglycohydrolase family protein [Steroidobacteraceae bacterium]